MRVLQTLVDRMRGYGKWLRSSPTPSRANAGMSPDDVIRLVDVLTRCDTQAEVLRHLEEFAREHVADSIRVVPAHLVGGGLTGLPISRTGNPVALLVGSPHPADLSAARSLTVCARVAEIALAALHAREERVAGTVVTERARLAREIHDGLAQQLAFLKMRVAWLKRAPDGVSRKSLDDLEGGLSLALAEARSAITTLRSQPNASITESIANYVQEFGQLSGLTVDVRTTTRDLDVAPRSRVELMRVVQEALNNVRKHARASRIEVELVDRRHGIEVSVRDNGVGIPLERPEAGHFGTAIMRERTEAIGGRLSLERCEGGGTVVRVWVPTETITRAEESVPRF